MNGEPLISIIIPAYKGEPWLRRAVTAILEAEKKAPCGLEILLCDDCSPDGTGALVDALAAEDRRIIPLHNETNQSVCYSRNRCLDIAKGEWICFADQDDVIDGNAFSVFQKTLDEDSDIIYYGFEDFFDGNEIPTGNGMPKTAVVFGAEEIRKLQWDCLCRYRDNKPLVSYRLLPVPWGKVYRRRFLNDYQVRFRVGLHREEDIGFNLIALAYCRKAKLCEYPLYHYRRSLQTQSHTYRPRITEETDRTMAWYREIIDTAFPGDPRMEEMLRFRELWGVLYNIALGCGHADNPGNYGKRKKEFLSLFSSSTLPAGKVLDNGMIRRLDLLHRMLGTFAKRKWFFPIYLMGKAEPLAYRLKIR